MSPDTVSPYFISSLHRDGACLTDIYLEIPFMPAVPRFLQPRADLPQDNATVIITPMLYFSGIPEQTQSGNNMRLEELVPVPPYQVQQS